MSKTTEVIIKPTTKRQVKRIKSENEVLKNDETSAKLAEQHSDPVQLQNRFNKSNPEDMKRLRLLKDKIRRCELQLAKHQSKLETLNTELNALNSQTTAND